MSVLGIIPARGGSKGIKRKNMVQLNSKPLIQYTIETAKNSRLDHLIVSTDDREIADFCLNLGVQVPFLRPQGLALDNSNSIDVAIHALKEVEKKNNSFFDFILYLQPTSPFRNISDINSSIELIKNNKNADSVISVVKVGSYHPARMKYLEKGFLIDPEFCEVKENQNRQELIPMYIRNGAIYLTKKETLMTGSFKGNKCLAYEMPEYRSINIDTIDDLIYAEWLINKNY